MKKAIALVLVLIMSLTLCACGGRYKVGSTIAFGMYEQDNNSSNGAEPITWIVLDVKDGKAMLISKYALDCKAYDTISSSAGWYDTTLYGWLNGEFKDAAFTSTELSQITSDVTLLMLSQAKEYFSSNDARKCQPTAYAKAQGVTTNEAYGDYCYWWLSTVSKSSFTSGNVANHVYYDGSVDGSSTYGNELGIRPVIWVSID